MYYQSGNLNKVSNILYTADGTPPLLLYSSDGTKQELYCVLSWLATQIPLYQGCWRNEGSLNRGMDRGRGLGIDGPFFRDSCSNLEINEAFQILHKLGLNIAE
jgi:hypothetical protein